MSSLGRSIDSRFLEELQPKVNFSLRERYIRCDTERVHYRGNVDTVKVQQPGLHCFAALPPPGGGVCPSFVLGLPSVGRYAFSGFADD